MDANRGGGGRKLVTQKGNFWKKKLISWKKKYLGNKIGLAPQHNYFIINFFFVWKDWGGGVQIF